MCAQLCVTVWAPLSPLGAHGAQGGGVLLARPGHPTRASPSTDAAASSISRDLYVVIAGECAGVVRSSTATDDDGRRPPKRTCESRALSSCGTHNAGQSWTWSGFLKVYEVPETLL